MSISYMWGGTRDELGGPTWLEAVRLKEPIYSERGGNKRLLASSPSATFTSSLTFTATGHCLRRRLEMMTLLSTYRHLLRLDASHQALLEPCSGTARTSLGLLSNGVTKAG